MLSITNQIQKKIKIRGQGWVFSAKDFLSIKHRNSVDKLLSRIHARGEIRKIGWGLYDNPIFDKKSGNYQKPNLEAIIRAVEIQLNETLQFGGEYAALLLGLTKSLPSTGISYLSNKQNRMIEVCGYKIKISRTSIPSTKNKYDKAVLAIQAIKYLGKKRVNTEALQKILKQLDDKEKRKLRRIAKNIEWINRLINT